MPPQQDIFSHLKRRQANTDSLPSGYSTASSAGYFSKKYADLLRPTLDALDPTTQAVGKKFYTKPYESIHTLYKKIYEGWRYLIERDDTPDKKYATLRDMIEIRKCKHFISLVWTAKNLNPEPYATEDLLTGHTDSTTGESDETTSKPMTWREQIMEWCMNAPNGVVLEQKHRMSGDEQGWLIAYLADFRDIVIISLDGFGLKLAKNEKLANKIREERGQS